MNDALYNYTYSILRYVHDITTGEFVNVGVAIFSANAKFSGIKCRATAGRLHKTFPTVNSKLLTKKLRHLQNDFDEYGERISSQFNFEKFENVLDIARNVLPNDDSSLQWSSIGSGRTANPNNELSKLYDRLVALYDEDQPKEHRHDEDVWRDFRRDLEEKNLLKYFKEKVITVKDDELEFRHAWKNGQWHCIQPISFDLSTSGNIKDKAHKWLGQMTSLESGNEKFKLYLLLGKPQDKSLEDAFNKAWSILEKIPGEKMLFKEQESNQLLNVLNDEIQEHSLN